MLDSYIDKEITEETGVVTYKELPSGLERPEVAPNYSFILITAAVIVGTLILLVIVKFKKYGIWKAWYFVSVLVTLSIAWAAFLPQLYAWIAAAVAAGLKILKPNFIIHNLTELFIYSGLAAIFVPVINIFSASILLILISIYDVYAVLKSKHMIKLAKFQTSTNLFAGLSIPKSFKSIKAVPAGKKVTSGQEEVAIIGGGDIGFPLLFAGAIMQQFGFQKAFIIPIFASLCLAFLFYISKKGKFYPAMPFIAAGCFVGYGFIKFLL